MSRFNPIRSADGATAVAELPPAEATPIQPAPAAPPAPAAGLRKVSFGKVAPKAADDTKTKYPVFNDPVTGPQVVAIAARIKTRAREIEALEGSQSTDKAELRMFVSPFYFKTNAGKAAPPSSISIPTSAGEVLVCYQNRYTKIADETNLLPILGEELTGRYFRQTFTLNVNGEDLPAGKEQEIVDKMIALLAEYNVEPDIAESVKPTPDFHIRRLTDFTPEVNVTLDAACPIICMIKTSGRGGAGGGAK